MWRVYGPGLQDVRRRSGITSYVYRVRVDGKESLRIQAVAQTRPADDVKETQAFQNVKF